MKYGKAHLISSVWLLITLFCIPAAAAASLVPMPGMLMLPKTVCYMLLVRTFWKYASGETQT